MKSQDERKDSKKGNPVADVVIENEKTQRPAGRDSERIA
jgi:hypothetical protein